MAAIVAGTSALAPDNRFDGLRPRPAKAVNRVDSGPVEAVSPRRIAAGAALDYAIRFLNLGDKEACDLLADEDGKPLDKALLSHWKSGARRLHLDRILNTKLHGPFVIALAHGTSACNVQTTVVYSAVPR